jgi:hypothetical protein
VTAWLAKWLPVAFTLLLLGALVGFFWAIRPGKKTENEQRGFEVKLDAGDEPVTEQKENDHG